MPLYITLQQVIDQYACAVRQEEFRETFGDRVKVSKRNVKKYSMTWPIDWAARHFLSEEEWTIYRLQTDEAKRKYHARLEVIHTERNATLDRDSGWGNAEITNRVEEEFQPKYDKAYRSFCRDKGYIFRKLYRAKP